MFPCPGLDEMQVCGHRRPLVERWADGFTKYEGGERCERGAGHDGPHCHNGGPAPVLWPAGTRRVVGSGAWARKHLSTRAAITSARRRRILGGI